jgi:hypothetical protein
MTRFMPDSLSARSDAERSALVNGSPTPSMRDDNRESAEMRADTCVRCGGDFWEGRHTNWDPKGPICSDCWFQDATEWMEMKLAEEREQEKECYD